MSKNKSFINMGAVIALCILVGSHTAGSVLIQTMQETFPGESLDSIYRFSTITSAMGIWIPLVVGLVLGKRIGYKPVMTFACISFLIGGCGPILFHSTFSQVLIFRAIYGIGNSLLAFRWALVTGNFTELSMRTKILGICNAVMYTSSIIMSWFFGILGDINVWYAFLIYGLAGFACAFCLLMDDPYDKVKAERAAGRETKQEETKFELSSLPIAGLKYCLLHLLLCALLYTYQMNISTVVAYRDLGQATISGLIASGYTFGSIIAGLIFNKLFQATKRFMLTAMFGIAAIGLAMFTFGNNAWLLFIGCVIVGTGYGTITPLTVNCIGDAVSTENHSVTVAINAAMGYLGATIAGKLATLFGSIFGGPAIGAVRGTLLCMAICAVIFAFVDFRPARMREQQMGK